MKFIHRQPLHVGNGSHLVRGAWIEIQTARDTGSTGLQSQLVRGAWIEIYYLRYREPEVNKTLLKADLKAGVKLEGAVLTEKNNIQIK